MSPFKIVMQDFSFFLGVGRVMACDLCSFFFFFFFFIQFGILFVCGIFLLKAHCLSDMKKQFLFWRFTFLYGLCLYRTVEFIMLPGKKIALLINYTVELRVTHFLSSYTYSLYTRVNKKILTYFGNLFALFFKLKQAS